MQQKIDLIHEIHAMLAVRISQQPKVVDLTSTSGVGYLSEMSVAEVCGVTNVNGLCMWLLLDCEKRV